MNEKVKLYLKRFSENKLKGSCFVNLDSYLKLLEKQRKIMTKEQLAAIEKQQRLQNIANQKMRERDELEERYEDIYTIGCEKLFKKYPNAQNLLPDFDCQMEMTEKIIENVSDKNSQIHNLSAMMKTIPELAECEKLNLKVAKAYFDFFVANAELNKRIENDRKILFSNEYKDKIRQFADEGVLLYFLETPDQPLLDEECTAEYILESFSFGDYLSARTLFSTYSQISNPGQPLIRKLEDAHAALEMMYNGCYRSAARNWFALIEHEHKRCADTLEGYWEVKKKYKNGRQRADIIYSIIDSVMGPWEQEAWDKINSFYKKLTESPKSDSKEINRNSIIHGDYYNDSIDISENDAMKLFLLWINLRVIADGLSFYEDFMRNKVTILPYLCTLYPGND